MIFTKKLKTVAVKLLKYMAVSLCFLSMAVMLCACNSSGEDIKPNTPSTTPGPDNGQKTTPEPTATPIPTPTPIIDRPEGRYDASIKARPAEDEVPVVNYVDEINCAKLNPFYCESETDKAIMDLTQLKLLAVDEDGNAVAGIEYPCLAYSIEELPYNTQFAGGVDGLADNWKAYRIVLKEGVTFADGTPVTADDVIFTVKTLADINYDGPSTLSSLNINGMEFFHTHIKDSTRSIAQECVNMGITEEGTIPEEFTGTPEWQDVWDCLDEAGIRMAQDVIDYVNNQYALDAYAQMFLSPNVTYEMVNANSNLKTVYAMVVWGYLKRQNYNYGTNKIRDYQNEVHDLNVETFNAETFWNMIKEYHGYNLSSADGISYESAIKGKTIEDYIVEVYCDRNVEDYAELFGVQPYKQEYADKAVRTTVDVLVDESVNIADFNFYIAEKSFYEGKEHNSELHGAGEYTVANVIEYEPEDAADGTDETAAAAYTRVELEANDSYMLGSPVKKYVVFTTEAPVVEEDSADAADGE